jgi:hypothetical protein
VVDSQVNLIRAQTTLIHTKYNKLIELVNLYSQMGVIQEKLKPIID